MTTDETTPRLDLPDELMGRHADSPQDMIDFVRTLLDHEAPVPKKRGLHFENAGDFRAYEDSAEHKVSVLVPLPYLDAADVTTDEIQETIAPCAPVGIKVEVAVAPPPNDGR